MGPHPPRGNAKLRCGARRASRSGGMAGHDRDRLDLDSCARLDQPGDFDHRGYVYCVGQIGGHFLWPGEDPLRSLAIAATELS